MAWIKKRGQGGFQLGAFTGLVDYRYGTEKKPTLPSLSIQHKSIVVDKPARRHLVSKAIDGMKDWRQTPFEVEGPFVHAIRSSLCLMGDTWAAANHVAETVVAEAFRSIGAKRPTWEQGQREYVVPDGNCAWCGLIIPDDLMTGKSPSRYCSFACASHARKYREYKSGSDSANAYYSMMQAVSRTRSEARLCAHCSTSFRPLFPTARFCSKRCEADARRTIAPRPCKSCGATFQPKNSGMIYCSRECVTAAQKTRGECVCGRCGASFYRVKAGQKYCSQECHHADRSNLAFPAICTFCDTPFIASSKRATLCSPACKTYSSGKTRGKWRPQRLTPIVFDHFFLRPINVAMRQKRFPPALSAEIFDTWFKRAA